MGEAEAAVADFDGPAVLAEANGRGAGKKLAGELPRPLLRIKSAGERQVVFAKPGDVVGVEGDVGVDPHEFGEAFAEGIGGHLVAGGVDGGVAADAPDGVAAAFEFPQRVIAGGIDGPADGNENDAGRRRREGHGVLGRWSLFR